MTTKDKVKYSELKAAKQPYMVCANCGGRAYMTYYRPPEGYDPLVREYRCRWGHKSYKLVRSGAAPTV